MALQLWTTTRLLGLDISLKRKIKFYAPLQNSLDFYGTDAVTFTRASTGTRVGRDGLTYTVAVNVPAFNYNGETPLGLVMGSTENLSYNAANGLNDANTVIWFESLVPMSTPTNSNPWTSAGAWAGNRSIYLSHVVKADSILANSEINKIQSALQDVIQVIPAP